MVPNRMITDEQSKAAKEIARTTGKFAEIAERVGGFVAKVIGPASNQVGGILEDWTRYFRYKNLLAIADKVENIHASRKIEGKTIPIPPRVAIPMLESASLEDDETLQEVWARLIANSTDPHFTAALHPGYIEIVRQMSPDEAIILSSFLKLKGYPFLFLNHVQETYEKPPSDILSRIWMGSREEIASYETIYEMFIRHCMTLVLKKPADSKVYIDNLLRLRIVELGHDFKGETRSDVELLIERMARASESDKTRISIPARDEFLRMTFFGQGFVSACIGENSPVAVSDNAELAPEKGKREG
jgi:hypothetical protein